MFTKDVEVVHRQHGYSMSVDGYFSTFSATEAVSAASNNEAVVNVDNWIVTNNNSEQASVNNTIQTSERDDLPNPTKSVSNVVADYLEISEYSSESELLQEIKASLDNGLEVEMALAAL